MSPATVKVWSNLVTPATVIVSPVVSPRLTSPFRLVVPDTVSVVTTSNCDGVSAVQEVAPLTPNCSTQWSAEAPYTPVCARSARRKQHQGSLLRSCSGPKQRRNIFKVARRVVLDQNGYGETLHAIPPTHRNMLDCAIHTAALCSPSQSSCRQCHFQGKRCCLDRVRCSCFFSPSDSACDPLSFLSSSVVPFFSSSFFVLFCIFLAFGR